jgi:hypothetical protein
LKHATNHIQPRWQLLPKNSEKLKIEIKKYFSKTFYKNKMESWNKIGKIKSFLILIFSLIPLFIMNVNENSELIDNYYLGISAGIFIFIILFLTLITKFWSLIGIEFKKPNWNENPLSLNFSKSLNFFQFWGICFFASGIIKFLFVGIFYQKLDSESVILFIYGISVLIGIKLSIEWLKLEGNKTQKTVANTVQN